MTAPLRLVRPILTLDAGPGPTRTYRVDLPFPWGDDTEVTVPIQQIVDDALTSAKPRVAEIARVAAESAVPVAVQAVDQRLPVWIGQVVREVQPEARQEVNRALGRIYFVGALLAAVNLFVAWRVGAFGSTRSSKPYALPELP